MGKTDILDENLSIKKLITVIKGKRVNCTKPLKVENRHSDAFVYVISGRCTYRFDDRSEFVAKPDTVLYLSHKSAYTMLHHTEEYKFIFCDFEFLSDTPRQSAIFRGCENRGLEAHFTRLLNKFNSPENTHAECMAILYIIYSILSQSRDKRYVGKTKELHTLSAKRYIDDNFRISTLTVTEVAEKCGISEVYLRRLFRESFGISPSEYLTEKRIDNAKNLMNYPFLKLEDCAYQSGFVSLQYFCRLFKKKTGISPGKYRSSRSASLT